MKKYFAQEVCQRPFASVMLLQNELRVDTCEKNNTGFSPKFSDHLE